MTKIYTRSLFISNREALFLHPHSPCVRDAGTAASPKPPAPLALVSLALSQSPPVQTKRGPLLVSSNTSRPCARSNTIAQPRALARPAPRRAFVALPRAAVASQVPSTVNCREHCAAMLTSTPACNRFPCGRCIHVRVIPMDAALNPCTGYSDGGRGAGAGQGGCHRWSNIM